MKKGQSNHQLEKTEALFDFPIIVTVRAGCWHPLFTTNHRQQVNYTVTAVKYYWLVVSTPMVNISQPTNSLLILEKIKNDWNHPQIKQLTVHQQESDHS